MFYTISLLVWVVLSAVFFVPCYMTDGDETWVNIFGVILVCGGILNIVFGTYDSVREVYPVPVWARPSAWARAAACFWKRRARG